MKSNCPFCSTQVDSKTLLDRTAPHTIVYCPQCGNYDLSNETLRYSEIEKANIAGYLFETKNARGENLLYLDRKRVAEILESPLIPRTVSDRISKLVTYIDANTRYFGQAIVPPSEIMYIVNEQEQVDFLSALRTEGLISLVWTNEGEPSVALKLKSFEFVKLRPKVTRPGHCFVAMWFDPSMDTFFENIVKPACSEAGYTAMRVSDKEFTGEITDEIIAGIKESAFVIADFTGHRGGVYYEAGFAIGLGKTVIQMCNEKDLGQLHFDINHRNTIFWNITDTDMVKRALANRIRATIGLGSEVKNL